MNYKKAALVAAIVFTAMMFWGCEKQNLPTPGYWEGKTNEGDWVDLTVDAD